MNPGSVMRRELSDQKSSVSRGHSSLLYYCARVILLTVLSPMFATQMQVPS